MRHHDKLHPRRYLLLLTVFLLASAASAEPPTPVGDEFQVNTTTAANQDTVGIGMSGAGTFIAVWESDFQDGDLEGIFARGYDADGAATTAELPINALFEGNQSDPSVAIAANGNFLVVWDSDGAGEFGGDRKVFARLFDASGTALVDEFQIDVVTDDDQNDAVVAALGGGTFAVVWESSTRDGSGQGLAGQLLDSDADLIGGAFAINQFTSGDQEDAEIAAEIEGGFVVTWESFGQDSSGDTVVARRFDAAGAASDDEFVVNTFTTGDQDGPAVAASPNGGFVVAWEDIAQVAGGETVYARFYDAAGTARGLAFQVNATDADDQEDVRIAFDSSGGAVFVWESFGQDGAGEGVYLRRFTTDGTAGGGEQPVNQETTGHQEDPVIATDARGRFAVAWISGSGQDGSQFGIFSRRWAGAIFTDGFESGDVTLWSTTN